MKGQAPTSFRTLLFHVATTRSIRPLTTNGGDSPACSQTFALAIDIPNAQRAAVHLLGGNCTQRRPRRQPPRKDANLHKWMDRSGAAIRSCFRADHRGVEPPGGPSALARRLAL